ncbi:uncharacterized protein [Fopius arisanus]|uniref:Uncharacterized protein n=1 Tax=Fopius arisanus TaxID=64838 RepID=A0A9R1TWF8_9HYME|nr:PREDICTED: uncharacterized protein LOC105263837 [Fopius arisanus]
MSVGRIDDFVDTIYILAVGCNLSYKAVNILTNRQGIIELLRLLDSKECQTLSPEEDLLRIKYHRRVRKSTIILCSCLEFTVANMIVSSVLVDIPERTFPLKIWLPSNFSEDFGFWTIYCSQLIAFTYAGTFHVFYDTFVIGIMITLSGQLQILQCRNPKMSAPDVKCTSRRNRDREIGEI